MKRMSWHLVAASMASLVAAMWLSAPARADEAAGETLLKEKCGQCHDEAPGGGLVRITGVRKPPEGWSLTISRMERWHALALSDAEEFTIVKWLADHQGLAPEEAAPYRYALERRMVVETPDDKDLAAMCAVCHTYARVALQRRDQSDWTKLVHMHLGQYPSVEYVGALRGRQWWKEASTEIPAKLAAKWPVSNQAWRDWSGRAPVDLSGSWSVAGHRPNKGDFSGRLVVKRTEKDQYSLAYDLTYADGSKLLGKGQTVVYTGYEWRGAVTLGKEKLREVYAVSPDGNRISGRWFLDDQDAIGGDMAAVRGTNVIAAVQPPYLKAGNTSKITIVGSGLQGAVDLGAGVKVGKVLERSAARLTVLATAAKDAPLGEHTVAIGKAKVDQALVVYDKVDTVKVEPATAVARMGGNGGPIAPVMAQLEAVGYMNAPGGKGEAVRIGPMAASWSVGNFDKTAAASKDAQFGGHMARGGIFVPASAGPNPKRGGYNNAANLSVKAEVKDGSAKVVGAAHVFVAPQRWNDAPIR